MNSTRHRQSPATSLRPVSLKKLTELMFLPLLLSLLLALPTTHAQSTFNKPLLFDAIFNEFSSTTAGPVLTIDHDLLRTFELLDSNQPDETSPSVPNAPAEENTATENQDGYTRPPVDGTETAEPAETTDTPSLFVPGTTAPADSTPDRTAPDSDSIRLPNDTFKPRLPGLNIVPDSPETPASPDCPPTQASVDTSIDSGNDTPVAPCIPAAPCALADPIIPVARPLLFVTPFLGLLLFWTILSYLNGRHDARSNALQQRHLRNRHLGTIDNARRQTCNELLDFLASSTDTTRPLNHQALEQFLARLALLGSPETNRIAEQIRTAFLKDDRHALKPLIGKMTASIRHDLQ